MFNRFATTAAFSMALAASVAVFGAVSASAQTTNTTGSSGYDMLNAQSANPSAGTNGAYNATYPYYGTTNSSSSTMNSAVNANTSTGVTNTTTTVNGTTTPGVPNTGAGGDAPINLAVLIISGLIVAGGMTYVTLRLAL